MLNVLAPDDQDGREPQDGAGEAVLDQRHQAAAAHQAETRGRLLHRGGERERDQRGPHEIEAERRADVRVRPDPGGVVVGGPGDEAGSQPTEIAEPPESGSEGVIMVDRPSSAGARALGRHSVRLPVRGEWDACRVTSRRVRSSRSRS